MNHPWADEDDLRRRQREQWGSVPEEIRLLSREDDTIAAFVNVLLVTDRMWDLAAATEMIGLLAVRDAERVRVMTEWASVHSIQPMIRAT